jgi:hypothetical protein
MFQRLVRTGLSFAIAAIAYAIYALIAVPLIEPSVKARGPDEMPADAGERAKARLHQYDDLFDELFPPNAWERQGPKVLESDQAMLLLDEHRPLGENRLKLEPCTMILFPQPRERVGSRPQGNPIVLRAQEGAELTFDGPLDFSQGKIGRLLGGFLKGEVVIFRRESRPGANDDIQVVTSNVQMDEQQVHTPHEVQFRFGRSYGSGRDLIISLLPAQDKSSKHGPAIGGIKSLELVHVDKVHLHLAGRGLLPGLEQAQKAPDDTVTLHTGEISPAQAATFAAANQFGPPDPPIEITCNGPFSFDAVDHVARFEEQVDVIRLNPEGPSDQLNCERLEIHFAERPAVGDEPDNSANSGAAAANNRPRPAPPPDGSFPALAPRQIIASGHPVMVRSPSNEAWAQGDALSYDIVTRELRLHGEQPVVLRNATSHVQAPAILYQPLPDSQLGRVWASGPGSFRGKLSPDKPGTLQATWRKELQLRPHEGQHVLSLYGAASVEFTETGAIASDEIHVWMKEVENSAGGPPVSPQQPLGGSKQIQPQKMKAIGNVTIDSPRLAGRTGQLEIRIRTPVKRQPAANRPGTAPGTPAARSSPPPNAVDSSNSGPLGIAGFTQGGDQRFDVTCDLLRVGLVRNGEKVFVDYVTAEKDVRLIETQTAKPGELPLELTGDHVQIVGATAPRTTEATVRGAPARVLGRGLSTKGGTIRLHRGQNRLRIDGPGEMQLPIDRDLDGNLLAQPQELNITWQDGMDFDGNTVRYNGAVAAATEFQRASAQTMEVDLAEPFDFAQPQPRQEIDIRQIRLDGQVSLENRTVEQGRPKSIDHLHVRNLKVDRHTGDIFADGPGWFTSVQRGKPLLTESPGATARNPAATDHTAGPPDDDQLNYVRTDFIRAITGNLHRKELRFDEQVRMVYGPVDDWQETIDPDSPEPLGEHDVLLNCDTLRLVQIGELPNGKQPVEVTAEGNSMVESRQFWARSHRITYVEAKELLVLEGDGRSDAQLWRQDQVGGQRSRSSSRKILYWKGTGQVEVDDARYFDWSRSPAGARR